MPSRLNLFLNEIIQPFSCLFLELPRRIGSKFGERQIEYHRPHQKQVFFTFILPVQLIPLELDAYFLAYSRISQISPSRSTKTSKRTSSATSHSFSTKPTKSFNQVCPSITFSAVNFRYQPSIVSYDLISFL